MNIDTYITDLAVALEQAGKGQAYIHACIHYAERLRQNKLPVIFDIHHFSLLLGVEKAYLTGLVFTLETHYREYYIPKKSGGARRLLIPSVTLKYIQRWILDNILSKMHISNHATGFRNNISIVNNASKHVSKACVINIDIKDFFPSINFDTVFKIFYYFGYTKEVSFILSSLCVYENMLPQGSPASPCLSNISCLKLDKRLSGLALSFEASYSRYADDITISGNAKITNCLPVVRQILSEEGFKINPKKTRIALAHQRQEVTGLVINDGKIRVSKKYKRSLMQEIYYCQKFGVDSHLTHIRSDKKFYKEHLYGKAYFLLMVERDSGKKAIKLLNEIKWDY